ncbi:MAG: LuxR C-terminal-related transcriptional regulator [Pseudomonadota bacterium]
MNSPAVLLNHLLVTKLNPPGIPPAVVLRSRVCAQVCAAQPARVVLVRAPAGFGKTTTMLQCRAQLEQAGLDTAWLTLDSGDNDAARFLAGLHAAVAKIAPAAEPAQGAPGDLALDLMARLAAHDAPFALLLDEFEHVRSPTVLELVRELIAHLPRGGRLIIGSRSRPELGLARLRARGQLLEIDTSQLRFSQDETAEFLTQRRQIALPDEDLATLYRKTEGWVAALWLASMALERHEGRAEFIARFSGSDDAVADYLVEDVMARQPEDVRDFLLRTSVLHHLNASLCDALPGIAGSAAMLARLESANLFLLPLEGDEKSWRYHSLFAGFLRQQATRSMAAQLAGLHSAAAAWHEQRGRIVPAIDHALASGSLEHALELLDQHGEQLLEQGRVGQLSRWFAAIPAPMLNGLPMVQVVRIWAVCYTRGQLEALPLLEALGSADAGNPDVRAHMLALRTSLLVMADRMDEAAKIGAAAMLELPFSRPYAESTLVICMALIHSSMGQPGQAHLLLDAARRKQGACIDLFHRMYSESVEGIIDMDAGRLRQACARFRLAVSCTHAASSNYVSGNAFAGVLYADTLYETGDLRQAAHLLHVYVPLVKDAGMIDHIIIGYLRLARIAFSQGDIDMVLQRLSELEYIGYRCQLPRIVSSAKLERARVLLLQGNGAGAWDELQRANDTGVWQRVGAMRMPAHDVDYYELGVLRWQVHFGDAGAALAGLDAEIAHATATARQRRLLKLQLLRSLALHQGGSAKAALAQLGEALRGAAREGFLRLVVDEGEALGSLVQRLAAVQRGDGEARQDPIFSDYVQRLAQMFPAAADDGAAQALAKAQVDALTQKEERILALLAEGYSNSALAEKLFISDSTVRTHLRNINAKLGAQSRTQAIAIARRLGIIA